MSQQSDLITAALSAANATVTNLQQLQVDQAKLDGASATQASHAADAATQAATDAAAVAAATGSIGTDLANVNTAAKQQADALAALSALSPAPVVPPAVVPPIAAPDAPPAVVVP